MGWYGGTRVFDAVASELVELSHRWVAEDYHEDFMEPLKALLVELEDMDWDTLSESYYWDHPVIGRILGNTFEEDEE